LLAPRLNAKLKLLTKLVPNSYQPLLLNEQPPPQLDLLQLVRLLVVDPPDLLQVHQIPVLWTKTHLVPQLAIPVTPIIHHPVVIPMVVVMVMVILMKTMKAHIYETI
jgi:hypothetical protein